MSYLIGEVASITGIAISTIHYYDREGLFPNMERSSGGIRKFTESEIDILRIVDCLKTSGMSIKEIKSFLIYVRKAMALCKKRRDKYYEVFEAVTKQLEQLKNIEYNPL